jgi:hypothetical protein
MLAAMASAAYSDERRDANCDRRGLRGRRCAWRVGLPARWVFELQDFGTSRDAEPRGGYLVALIIGLGISAAPLAAWRLLLSGDAPA